MSRENHNMPAKGGEVGFHFPDEDKPPTGTKLLIITAGGVLIVSDWQNGMGHQQWSYLPKKRKRNTEPTDSAQTQGVSND